MSSNVSIRRSDDIGHEWVVFKCEQTYSIKKYKLVFTILNYNKEFHSYGEAKFANGGLVLGWSKFSLLPPTDSKNLLDWKVVKMDSKIITLICSSKSVTHAVFNRLHLTTSS